MRSVRQGFLVQHGSLSDAGNLLPKTVDIGEKLGPPHVVAGAFAPSFPAESVGFSGDVKRARQRQPRLQTGASFARRFRFCAVAAPSDPSSPNPPTCLMQLNQSVRPGSSTEFFTTINWILSLFTNARGSVAQID